MMQDYLLELSSEIIPMLIVGILAMCNKTEKRELIPELIPSLIALSIIEIPAFVVTICCIAMGIPQSSQRHEIIIAIFASIALIYIACYQRKHSG